MTNTFRWGIVGTGSIVHRWLPDFFQVPGASLEAICSTSMKKARGIADRYSPRARCFERMEEFVGSGIDIAYIATNHPYHFSAAKACLEAGIPVLCEKPITPTARQLRELMDVAQRAGTFLMEALWTRFFPATFQVERWLAEGKIGEIVHMRGSFTGGPLQYDPQSRLFHLEEAGGALLDIGVYLLHTAAFYAGQQTQQIDAAYRAGPGGVDITDSLLLRYPNGATANLFCSVDTRDNDSFTILGTRGSIVIGAPFWRPREAVLLREGVETRYADPDGSLGEGFRYEIGHVQQCVAEGLGQSPLMPLSRSLEILELCDSIRGGWGLRFPGIDPAS